MSNLHNHSIIVAQCTPHGQGALALIRLTGEHVFTLIDKICLLHSKKKIVSVPTHTVHYGTIINDQNELIDKVLFLKMDAPHTFTGHDTVEITCHNNVFIINAIIERAIYYGAKLAAPGEFTKLSVMNKKIDLIQAEAIDELIHATSLANVKSALKQLEGSFSAWLDDLEQQFLHLLALCAASFEFIEEENIDFTDTIKNSIAILIQHIEQIEKNFNAQIHLKEGFKVALVGCVNAGKSSLFNAIIGKKRAIVNATAGTTRDVIEATIVRNGMFWTLIDTAGLRTTKNIIEQEGIAKSFEEAAGADILLLVYDSTRVHSAEEIDVYDQLYKKYSTKVIKVYNKSDTTMGPILSDGIHCSALFNSGIETLTEAIAKKIDMLHTKQELPFLVNKRHLLVLETVKVSLTNVISLCNKEKIAYELVSCQLHDILVQLSELSGKTVSEKIMDRVFATFCVGK